MKKSLIIRWLVIAVLIFGWTYSMFPLQDGDIIDEFKSRAEDKVKEYEGLKAKVDAMGGKDAVVQKMQTIVDRMGAEYRELHAMYNSLEKLDNYNELTKRLDVELAKLPQDISKKDRAKLSYRLLERAAGTEDGTRNLIRLNDYVKVSKNERASNANVLRFLRRCTASPLTLGLDLQGGTEFIVGFDEAAVLEKNNQPGMVEWTRDQIRTILENRLNKLGVTEPEIRVEGSSTVSVKMPAVSEGEKASIRKTIQDSAKLSFHLVTPGTDENGKPYEMMKAALISKSEDGEEIETDITIRREPTEVLGSDIVRALPQQDNFGRWTVGLNFNEEGAKAFGRVTGANIGQALAIVLDGKVYSAPTIQGAITGGNAQITGDFSYEEARQLASVISSGNLPTDISITSEFGTDPTLGMDSIRSGCLAGAIGLALVVVFMIWYYHTSGCIAVLALVVNTLLTLGSMALLKATITLPGIAGMILTIGMAVDANVLIFERIREELAKKKTLPNAIESGYGRAFWSIFDANITTLVTCVCLYWFGSGSVKGFAVTLSWGIVASMFTAIFMTRAVFDLLIHCNVLHSITMHSFSCLRNPQVKFLSYRKIAMVCSIVACVIGVGVCFVRGRNMLGIEFSGGTQITYVVKNAAAAPSVEAVRDSMKAHKGFEQSQVGYKTGEGSLQVLEITVPANTSDKTDEEIAAEAKATADVNAANATCIKMEKAAKDAAEALKTATEAVPEAEKTLAEAKDDAAKTAATKALDEAKAALEKATAEDAAAKTAVTNANAARDAAESKLAMIQGRVDPNSLLATLQKDHKDADFQFGGTKVVGAHVGSQFCWDAFFSLVASLIGVIIYLAFRFELKYGVGAVIAVVHDVVVAGGLFFLFGGRLTPSVVAALMTIIGYSLNDTIVIYDRLRETKEFYKDLRFEELVNLAINQTLSRTILTTITTVLAVASIVILAGGDVQDFSIVMLIGLFVGTYSTIFIATALINTWTKKEEHYARKQALAKK